MFHTTVAELIAKLQRMPDPQAWVMIECDDQMFAPPSDVELDIVLYGDTDFDGPDGDSDGRPGDLSSVAPKGTVIITLG